MKEYDDSIYYVLYKINILIIFLLFCVNFGKHSIQLSNIQIFLGYFIYIIVLSIPLIVMKIFHILAKKYIWKPVINNTICAIIEIISVIFYLLIILVSSIGNKF